MRFIRSVITDSASCLIAKRLGSRRSIFLLLLVFVNFNISSCLRYVPSRAELQEDAETASSTLGGPDEFLAYETRMTKRLMDFASNRLNSASSSGYSSYRLGPGDVVKIDVFGLPELATQTEVTGSGELVLPYLDSVQVSGLTVAEAKKRLSNAYRVYVRSPRLRLEMVRYGSSTVSVMGSVVKPGVYALKNANNTITDVLSLAGGRTEKAGTTIVILPAKDAAMAEATAARASFGGTTTPIGTSSSPNAFFGGGLEEDSGAVQISLNQIYGDLDSRPLRIPLVAGDTIVVPEAGRVKVDGEVNKPGDFPLTRNTSALGAIAAAGGLTYSANVHEVEIIRDIGKGKKASYVLDLENVARNGSGDVILRNSDVIRVPSEPGLFRTRQVVEFLNGFFRAGVNGSMR